MSTNFSNIYMLSNFIKGVNSIGHIQIQNKSATKVTHSIDYRKVTLPFVNKNFLMIYQTDVPNIALQFSSNIESSKALIKFRDIVNQLKNNNYNNPNNNISKTICDPLTFIHKPIKYGDLSIKIISIDQTLLYDIVAKHVISVYTSRNQVKVKAVATDTIISISFQDNESATQAAELLRKAIKEITDRTPSVDPSDGFKSFSKEFNSDVWKLEPNISFSLSSFSLEYYEIVGNEMRRCKGLVEYVGDTQSDILQHVLIKFNQKVKGKAIIISN